MSAPFPETYWSVIQRAIRDSRSALNRIASDYGAPVRGFIERGGFSPEDAEDLAQEVFIIVCDPTFLKQADAAKGRFRTLVLLVTKNVMNGEWRKRYAKKRHGKVVSLDQETVAEILASPVPTDERFEREWWESLLAGALQELRKEDPKRSEILRLHKDEGKTHAEIAKALSSTPVHINNEVRAAKKRLREILFARIRAYCSSQEEYEEELSRLQRMLS